MKILKEFSHVKYFVDGTLEVLGNKEGMPRITAVIPAPDVNHKTEIARQETHRKACEGITLEGYLIVSKKLIKNQVFDKKGQKTTLRIVYRPCMNEREMKELTDSIRKILSAACEVRDNDQGKKRLAETS